MSKEVKTFIKICKKDQNKLKSWLYNKLKSYGYNPKADDGYLLAVGSKIMLTAHMDTVHDVEPKNIVLEKHETQTIISSPQGIGGDDRCGVYMILSLLDKGYRPTILFCEDEEIGGVGSDKFTKTNDAEILNDMLYILELDRKGSEDAVYYDCGNKDFQKYVESFGFKKNYGSFSDIGHLSPAADVASVNLSCGYYNQHTLKEYVVFEEMEETINKVTLMLDDEENIKDKYDYQEEKYSYSNKWYNDIYDDYYGYGYGYGTKNYYGAQYYTVLYMLSDFPDMFIGAEYVCRSLQEAVGAFLMEHDDMTYGDIVEVALDDELWELYSGDEIIYEQDLSPYYEAMKEDVDTISNDDGEEVCATADEWLEKYNSRLFA